VAVVDKLIASSSTDTATPTLGAWLLVKVLLVIPQSFAVALKRVKDEG